MHPHRPPRIAAGSRPTGSPTLRLAVLALCALALLAAARPASAVEHVVQAGGSIQAAVDAAGPGDTIRVEPGIYTPAPGARSVVAVRTSGLALVGSLGAVIDAAGADFGVLFGDDRDPTRDGCPPHPRLADVRLRGFTVSGAAKAGVRVVGVRRYRVSRGFHVESAGDAVAVSCSREGRIDHNLASGVLGTALRAEDSETLRIDHNILKHAGLGIEIVNALHVVVRSNWITNNGAGVVVAARPNHPLALVHNVSIERNWIVENHRPVPAGDLPTGVGILNLGGDDVSIRENSVIDNGSLGIASFASPWGDLDPRIEPFVDGLKVRSNIVKHNGRAPDTARLRTPAADVVFVSDVRDPRTHEVAAADPDPGDNCFVGNHLDSEHPAGVTERHRCP